MAFDTVRTNKMRSGLTVLGVVIGITSIVGMTALIRGFDESVRDMMRSIGPNTIFGATIAQLVAKFTPIPAELELWSIALGIGITALVGLFFGLYPAMRAARLDPIEALRRE